MAHDRVRGARRGRGPLAYRRLVAGDLVVDLSIGRTLRPLGPLNARIEAPRDLVFEVIASPYLASPPSSLAEKIQVLERSKEMVLAAHRTAVEGGLVTTTVETVRFEPPVAVHFRLVRGPVPHVIERFELMEDGDATLLHYEGELGADLWPSDDGGETSWPSAGRKRCEGRWLRSRGSPRCAPRVTGPVKHKAVVHAEESWGVETVAVGCRHTTCGALGR